MAIKCAQPFLADARCAQLVAMARDEAEKRKPRELALMPQAGKSVDGQKDDRPPSRSRRWRTCCGTTRTPGRHRAAGACRVDAGRARAPGRRRARRRPAGASSRWPGVR
ncbi:MAG: hypothetical protein R2854_28410 [Caldilineaceae bacterium]